ncbi:MAG: hypothetical protein M5R41_18795 [Bacteroidia bacterium]|nr:hypothetical protein [Bacteroidia bacterium]
MIDLRTLELRCMSDSRIVESLLDNFLLRYSDERDRLSRGIAYALRPYRHILEEMPEGWGNYLTAQLMAHTLFGENALARKYRAHAAVRGRSRTELDFFEYQLQHPWRWRFMRLIEGVGDHFYRMVDACSEEVFLVRSSSLTTIIREHRRPSMIILLTFHSGDCLQTYGPMLSFGGMLYSDILPLARMIDKKVRTMEDVPASMDADPIPYLMLWRFGNVPILVHGKDVFISHYYEVSDMVFSVEEHRKHFHIEHIDNVFHLRLKRWHGHPHFSELYYDATKRLLVVQSLTDRGWRKLTETLAAHGTHVDDSGVLRLSMFGRRIAEEHFNTTYASTAYAELFVPKMSQAQQDDLDAINRFLAIYMENENAGRVTDIRQAAAAAGISLDTAREITQIVMEKQAQIRDKRR